MSTRLLSFMRSSFDPPYGRLLYAALRANL
jgi:hypothetical protein